MYPAKGLQRLYASVAAGQGRLQVGMLHGQKRPSAVLEHLAHSTGPRPYLSLVTAQTGVRGVVV